MQCLHFPIYYLHAAKFNRDCLPGRQTDIMSRIDGCEQIVQESSFRISSATQLFLFSRMHSISTLIFDLGGVIINLKSEQDWLEQNLLPNFHPESLQQLQQQHFFHDFETGKITPSDFIRQLKSIALEKNVSDETIIRHWNGILKDIPAHRIDLLRRLKDRHRLILLSNTNAIHVDAIRRYMKSAFGEDVLESSFHTCYYSQQIGLRKPGREIYEFVLQEQKLPAERCVFLDDKPENLTEPGKLGIRTILVDKDISELIAGDFFSEPVKSMDSRLWTID